MLKILKAVEGVLMKDLIEVNNLQAVEHKVNSTQLNN
jgi:hypothetical protein